MSTYAKQDIGSNLKERKDILVEDRIQQILLFFHWWSQIQQDQITTT